MKEQNSFDYSILKQDNVVQIAKKLIGVKLFTKIDDRITSGIIVETEAYAGKNDKACHAHQQKFTKRTKTMFEEGGTAYIYLCYGIHHLFNIVTNVEGYADAVLIRAVHPVEGKEIMLERRSMAQDKNLTNGPGKLTQAMGITKSYNGWSLENANEIWLQDYKQYKDSDIVSTTRIGIDYAGEDALLPYRFYLKNNPYVSKL